MSLPLSQIPVAILAGGLATRLRPIGFSKIDTPPGLGY